MKIVKKQYGGPVYSPQGLQNISNQVLKFIEDGGVKGWLDRRKDKKFIEDFKKKNPTKEEALNINPETGVRSEKPLVSEDWAIASAVIPAFGGGLGIKAGTKSLKKAYSPDRVVDINHPNAINFISDVHPDPVKNHPNKFWKFLNDDVNLVTGKTATIDYLKSSDYRNQLRKNFPNITDSEIDDIINHHIAQINNTEVWISETRNVEDWATQGEFHPAENGEHLIRIWNNSENPFNSRQNLKHEYFHTTHGAPGKDPFYTALEDKDLLGEGLNRVYSKSGDIASTGRLGLELIKKYDELTPEELSFLNDYLVKNGKDEVRVRALKMRDWVSQILEKERRTNPNITWDEVYKNIENKLLNLNNTPGQPGIYDIQQLYRFFTPESIKKYVERVMTVGVPAGVVLNENKETPTKMQYGGPLYSPQGIQNVGNTVVEFIDNGGLKGWIERRKTDKFNEEVKQRLNRGIKHTIRKEEPLKSEDWAIASTIIPALGGVKIKDVRNLLKKPRVSKAIDYDATYTRDVPDEIFYNQNNTFLEHRFRDTDPNIDRALDDLEKYFLSDDYKQQLRKHFPNASEQQLEAYAWKQIDNIYKPTIYTSDTPNVLEPHVRGYYKEAPDGSTHIELYGYDKRTPNKTYNDTMHEIIHASRGTYNSEISRDLRNKSIANAYGMSRTYPSTIVVNGTKKTVDKSHTGLVLQRRYKDYSPEDRAFIDYLLDGDEARDRAINARRHMIQYNKTYDEFVSGPKSFDIEQLYQFFTPESVKEFIDKVFIIGMPIGLTTNILSNGKERK